MFLYIFDKLSMLHYSETYKIFEDKRIQQFFFNWELISIFVLLLLLTCNKRTDF